MDKKAKAQERLQVIMEVRSGRITATEGARRLGVSRKTFYEWENRGLAALMGALEDGDAGRPAVARDPEKETLEARIKSLEAELATAVQQVSIKEAALRYERQKSDLLKEQRKRGSKKKRR